MLLFVPDALSVFIDACIFAYDGRYRCMLIMFIYELFERVVGVSTIVYSFCEGYNLK